MVGGGLLDEVEAELAVMRGPSMFMVFVRTMMVIVVFTTVTMGLWLNAVSYPWLFGLAAITIMMWMRGQRI